MYSGPGAEVTCDLISEVNSDDDDDDDDDYEGGDNSDESEDEEYGYFAKGLVSELP
jgi:hypothetical protein